MSEPALTAFDIAAVAVIGLSVLVAFLRGFLRETLTIITWLGAGVAAYFAFPYARELARGPSKRNGSRMPPRSLAFVVPLIASRLRRRWWRTTYPAARSEPLIGWPVWRSAPRAARSWCAAYLGLVVLVAPEEQPEWVKDALILPYVKDGAALLTRLILDDFAARGVLAFTRLPHAGLPTLAPAAGPTP